MHTHQSQGNTRGARREAVAGLRLHRSQQGRPVCLGDTRTAGMQAEATQQVVLVMEAILITPE